MKLFISQPMRGLNPDEIQKERDAAYRAACLQLGEKPELIDSRVMDKTIAAAMQYDNPVKRLGFAIYKLGDADVAYFAEGWERARGCRIEMAVAAAYGIRIIASPSES